LNRIKPGGTSARVAVGLVATGEARTLGDVPGDTIGDPDADVPPAVQPPMITATKVITVKARLIGSWPIVPS
jgi:hypothetical protein